MLTLSLKVFFQFCFILQALILLVFKIPFRLIKWLWNGKQTHHPNFFKNTHSDVFKDKGIILINPLDSILKHDGFNVEEYEFETEDHAFVTFWRVRAEIFIDQNTVLDPVIIQHGLLDCSMSWFLH